MELLLVRHGESEGNVQKRMQGHRDYELSERGREQAKQLAGWLQAHELRWDVAYCSPLMRAEQTARLLAEHTGWPPATVERDLAELHAGELEGMSREDMERAIPHFLARPISGLGDFGEFGGESYDDVQTRARRLLDTLEARHRAEQPRVLLVGHGGINFQLLKMLVCQPVPRICILRMGNCTATLVRMRERRGSYIGEVVWHVPLELMGGQVGEGVAGIFR